MAFKKLICNLLLNDHPICIARFTHPICMKYIHQYYLNAQTVWLEYAFHTDVDLIKKINNTLQYAVKYGYVIVVKWCLKNGADIHIQDNLVLLIAAIKTRNLEIFRLLIDKDADIHSNDKKILCYAYENDIMEIFRFMLEKHKFSIYAITSAIELACADENVKIIKLLVSYL